MVFAKQRKGLGMCRERPPRVCRVYRTGWASLPWGWTSLQDIGGWASLQDRGIYSFKSI